MASVTLSRLTKAFGGTPAVRDVSLDIRDGEFLTLVGASGCGKTTVLRMIAGLERQDSGSILIGDRRVDDDAPAARDVAMVFQSYALYPHLTVFDNIAAPLTMRRLRRFERLPLVGRALPRARQVRRGIRGDVEAVADSLGLTPLLARKPGQLSGGQRQRVALGRALVRRPSVFLMDEPLSNLDAKLRVEMRAELTELHRRIGITIVYVTHDQIEAMTMSDRVAVMISGELLQVGTPREVYRDPQSLAVARFIGSPPINLLPANLMPRGWAAACTADAATLAVRPEHLVFAREASPGSIPATVTLVEYAGSDLFVHLRAAGDHDLVARRPVDGADTPERGAAVHLRLSPDDVLMFDDAGCRMRNRP